ncbi:MAG: ATP-binding protein [Desulfobulbaceae bacterium]|nr:ATP-binding protein [Desulfobulbaceae bacterium]
MSAFLLDIEGKVRKVKTDDILVPLFEAIMNSIHAINECSLGAGEIKVEIFRDPAQKEMALDAPLSISGFKVTDNGSGFNEKNMESFQTGDSTYKLQIGGKGIGRFTWLKFFEQIEISSVYKNGAAFYKRAFVFSRKGVSSIDPVLMEDGSKGLSTSVEMKDLYSSIQKVRPNPELLAEKIVEHFLSIFVTDAMPKVVVNDSGIKTDLNEYYKKNIRPQAQEHKFDIRGKEFTYKGIKYYQQSKVTHAVLLCGNKRVAEKIGMKNIYPFVNKKFGPEDEGYIYLAYIESPYLDLIVNEDRDGFRFPVDDESFIEQGRPTKEEILEKVKGCLDADIGEHIGKIKENNINRVKRHIEEVAPQYRHLLKCEDRLCNISEDSPEKIDLALRKIQFQQEIVTREEVSNFIKNMKSVEPKELAKKSKELYLRLNDAEKSSLAQYIVNRRLILDLLLQRLNIGEETRAKEEAIHELIFPLGETSETVTFEEHNLWIIDERLAYHSLLASDKKLKTIAVADSNKEPDLIIFNNPLALDYKEQNDFSPRESITIIEFKRPGKVPATDEKNPVDQVLGYIKDIREKKIKTVEGRSIETRESTSFFCYILCDLEDPMKEIFLKEDMTLTPDGAGMFKFHKGYNAYIEVISYNKMITDATKRNRVFFDKLNISALNR